MQLGGLGQFENTLASSRIEPVTFSLVAQCLNQLQLILEIIYYTPYLKMQHLQLRLRVLLLVPRH